MAKDFSAACKQLRFRMWEASQGQVPLVFLDVFFVSRLPETVDSGQWDL